MTEKKMAETKMNPEEQETFFDSPHIPFYHLLFYPSWFRLRAGLGESVTPPRCPCFGKSAAVRGFPVLGDSVGPAPPYGFCSLRLGVSARELVLVAAAGRAGTFVLFVVEESFWNAGTLEYWNRGDRGASGCPSFIYSLLAWHSRPKLGTAGARRWAEPTLPALRQRGSDGPSSVLRPLPSALRPPSSLCPRCPLWLKSSSQLTVPSSRQEIGVGQAVLVTQERGQDARDTQGRGVPNAKYRVGEPRDALATPAVVGRSQWDRVFGGARSDRQSDRQGDPRKSAQKSRFLPAPALPDPPGARQEGSPGAKNRVFDRARSDRQSDRQRSVCLDRKPRFQGRQCGYLHQSAMP